MPEMRYSSICVVALVLGGCGAAKPYLVSTVESLPDYAVEPDDSVCVMAAADRAYKDSGNSNSGERLGKRVILAVERSGRNAMPAEALADCASQSIRYALAPELLHYQNRYTGFSGNADRISVKVDLLAVDSGAEINGFFITTQSDFNSMVWEYVDSKPDALLGKEFDRAVLDLLDGKIVPGP